MRLTSFYHHINPSRAVQGDRYLVWAQTYHSSNKGFSQFQRKTKCGTISLALDQTPNGFEAIVFIADNFIKKAGDLEAIDAYRKKFGPVR